MPETIEQEPLAAEVSTHTAAELKKSNDAALKSVTGKGFDDPEFDTALQSAMDKDAGKEPAVAPEAKSPAEAALEAKPEEKKAEAKVELKLEPGDDLPPELLGIKPKAEKKEVQTDADRQKFLEEQTKGMSPKASERFKSIEKKAWEAEQAARKSTEEAATLKKQLVEVEQRAKTQNNVEEVASLKKQIEEMDEHIKKVNLQEHPKFKAHYDGQINSEIETAKKFVKAEVADEVAQLLAIPESKKRNERLTEIVDEMTDIEKVKFLSSLDKIDRLSTEKSAELTNWKKNNLIADQLAAKQQSENIENQKQMADKIWTESVNRLTAPESQLELYRKVDGNDQWNSTVDNRLANVKRMFTSPMPPEKAVEMAALAMAAPEYRRMFLAQRVLVQKLSEELESLKGAEPNLEGGGGEGGGIPDHETYEQSVDRQLKAKGILR